MKTQKSRKRTQLCALILGIVTLINLFGTALPVWAATQDESVSDGTGTNTPVHVNQGYSYRAIVNGSFEGFAFSMPTWSTSDASATLYLYQWQGTYDKTMAAQPIASKEFNPLTDGGYHWVQFEAQPAGEYLFHIANASAQAGVWTYMDTPNDKGFLYLNGLEQKGSPHLMIRFTEPVAEPFGVCEPSAELRNAVIPFRNFDGWTPSMLDGPYGVRLNVADVFHGIEFEMATYHATDLETNMSVYAWKGSYDKTIKEAPVVTKRILLADNTLQGISFDKLPAGDYLFLIHDFTSSPAVFTYNKAEGFLGEIYKNGVPLTAVHAFPNMRVVFATEREDGVYFLPNKIADDGCDGNHTPPAEYQIPENSPIYTHPVQPDTWVFTDGLGRESLTYEDVGPVKDDKTLAMFYWTWHIDRHINAVPGNLQNLSEKYPEAMNDYDNPIWEGTGMFWWDESIYGFYRSDDPWVLRKHGELLANAGVDVIFTDNTNEALTWKNGYAPLMQTWSEALSEGLRTPKISFMLPFWDKTYTNEQLHSLYMDVYRPGKYQDTWFYWEGKPMLMAMGDSVHAGASMAEKEIANFFTFRAGQPGYSLERTDLKNWGWLSLYPQNVYFASREDYSANRVEQMTVGVCQNYDYVNGVLSAMNGKNIMGRSYTSDYQDRYEKEGAEASKWGYNFAEQWKYALEVDPKVVFVTGWNERLVSRFSSWSGGTEVKVENAFPDQFNNEFSRDIEPSKGALQDHYYYQLVNFVRQFKGATPIPTPSANKTVDLTAGADQWADVAPYYGAYIGNTDDRNAQGYGDLVYTETSGRNDIIGAQIARDNEYVYFHVECAENITAHTDPLWMTLYIDSDQQNSGWNTFDFVINKSAASADTVVLEKFNGDGYASVKVADCAYAVDGKTMTVKVAKSDLGLVGSDYTINFSWTDNVHDEGDYTTYSGDIMDFYISGDVAPGGRFKYSYISTSANAGGTSAEVTTDANTIETTAPESTPTGEGEPETKTETTQDVENKKGCASSMNGTALMSSFVVCAATALLLAGGYQRKKHFQ